MLGSCLCLHQTFLRKSKNFDDPALVVPPGLGVRSRFRCPDFLSGLVLDWDVFSRWLRDSRFDAETAGTRAALLSSNGASRVPRGERPSRRICG